MMNTSELENSLNSFFHWNKARMSCFIKMLLALFAVRTVNLREMAVAFNSKVQIDSRYKRLQRFFRQCDIDYSFLARWIFNLFGKEKVYLTIDRTNWKFGKANINIMVLGIVHEGIAIPIFWELLDKDGSSSAEEQKVLIKRFIKTFGKSCIAGVLADREFASGNFFAWLLDENIPFFIRIKENAQVKIANDKYPWSARDLFNKLRVKEMQAQAKQVVYGVKVYMAAARSERGELMIVVTNQNPKNAVTVYLRRWEIECLFQALKSNGFKFEATHMTKPARINKLLALLAIGFCWAHKVGEWRAEEKPIIFKKHFTPMRTELRPQYSFFRYGLDLLRDIVLNIYAKRRLFLQCVHKIITLNPLPQEILL